MVPNTNKIFFFTSEQYLVKILLYISGFTPDQGLRNDVFLRKLYEII